MAELTKEEVERYLADNVPEPSLERAVLEEQAKQASAAGKIISAEVFVIRKRLEGASPAMQKVFLAQEANALAVLREHIIERRRIEALVAALPSISGPPPKAKTELGDEVV